MTDIESYARAWRERRRREREVLAAEETEARAAAERCARHLVEVFGARRVILFGSLSRRCPFAYHRGSDLDLAIDGLADDRYWAALRDLAALLPPGMEIDLVPLEDATDALRAQIDVTGEVVCERA